jgi:DNA-directed RNA polymerase specialized sigma24 family protein
MLTNESALLEAISISTPDPVSDKRFMLKSAKAAPRSIGEAVEEDEALSAVPQQFQRVLLLPSPLRTCFVLKTLMNCSRHACSGLLNRSEAQIDATMAEAFRQLAAIPRRALLVGAGQMHPPARIPLGQIGRI